MSWKGFGRNRSCLNRGTILELAWMEPGQPRETSVMMAGVRTEHLQRRVSSATTAPVRYVIMSYLILYNVGGLLDQFCPNCTRYSTGDAVRIGNSFIYTPNHTSLLPP
jgi:hypothetical protein